MQLWTQISCSKRLTSATDTSCIFWGRKPDYQLPTGWCNAVPLGGLLLWRHPVCLTSLIQDTDQFGGLGKVSTKRLYYGNLLQTPLQHWKYCNGNIINLISIIFGNSFLHFCYKIKGLILSNFLGTEAAMSTGHVPLPSINV